MSENHFKQLLESIRITKAELTELDYSYLLPQEKEALKQLSFFPKVTVNYLTRFRTINLLTRFEIGITLEARVYTLGLDNIDKSDKVTTQ